MSVKQKYSSMIERYHKWMNDVFEAYGVFVAHHPFIPLIMGIMLLGGLCVGLIRSEEETDLEKLWVEHGSRVVGEREFFNSKFGGVPRKEGISINSKSNKALDLGHAMDALLIAITPLYDNLTMTIEGLQFDQVDFCERPMIHKSLKRGADPWKAENWIAWGYRKLFSYAMVDKNFGYNVTELPPDWGIDELPCYKISPMDCFKEGGDFDYPESLRQIDQAVRVPGYNLTVPQVLFQFMEWNNAYMEKLRDELNTEFKNHSPEVNATSRIEEILSSVKGFTKIVAAWGYNWRKPYKEMPPQEIIDYINEAIQTANNTGTDPLKPAALDCILKRQSCCLSWFGVHTPIEASLGNVVRNAGNISKVGAIRWVANHFHQNHPLWIDYIQEKVNATYTEHQRKDLVIKWEDHLVKTVNPLRQNKPKTTFGKDEFNSDLQVQFSMWKSAEDVIKDANHTPKWELILSVALVSIYSVLAFNDIKDPVHSHTMLILMGMIVVSFSILAGFGLTAASGIKFTPLAASVVPFLALGLGIDDIFVLTTILRSYLKKPELEFLNNTESSKPENEMRFTVALAGPSLVLTTFSILASFFISSVTPMPIVRWFCWQMGITASIHTCGMLLIFIPLMSIDAQRVKAGIVDPCLWPFCGLHRKKGLNGNEDPHMHGARSSKDVVYVTFEGQKGSSLLSNFVAKYYAPLFHSNIFKIGVVIVFSGLLGSMIYLGIKVEHGLKISEITVKGSYQHDYAVVTENGFPVYDIWIVTSSVDYPNSQPQLLNVYETMQELKTWAPAQPKVLELSWLANLYLAKNQTMIPPQQFYTAVQEWSHTPLGLLSMQDLACYDSSTHEALSCIAEGNNSNYRISATKSLLFANGLGAETNPNLDMIKQTRKALDNASKKHFNGTKLTYAYGYPYLFFEQYLHSIKDMLTVVGFAIAGVFIAVLLFQCNFTIALMIAVVLLMVDVEVFGFLYVIGAKLNSLSLVNLGIVIGMSAEFTYLARCFLVIDGTKNERVGRALQWTFEPLLHGLGTQIAATLPLIFLKYHAFRLYYFAMFTIMGVLGFLNGFVLLPVLLTWLGPPPLLHATRERASTINGPNGTTLNGNENTGNGYAESTESGYAENHGNSAQPDVDTVTSLERTSTINGTNETTLNGNESTGNEYAEKHGNSDQPAADTVNFTPLPPLPISDCVTTRV